MAAPAVVPVPSRRWYEHVQWGIVCAAAIVLGAFGGWVAPGPPLDSFLGRGWDAPRTQVLIYGVALVIILWLARQSGKLTLIAALLAAFGLIRTVMLTAPAVFMIVLDPGPRWVQSVLTIWGMAVAFVTAVIGAFHVLSAFLDARGTSHHRPE